MAHFPFLALQCVCECESESERESVCILMVPITREEKERRGGEWRKVKDAVTVRGSMQTRSHTAVDEFLF